MSKCVIAAMHDLVLNRTVLYCVVLCCAVLYCFKLSHCCSPTTGETEALLQAPSKTIGMTTETAHMLQVLT